MNIKTISKRTFAIIIAAVLICAMTVTAFADTNNLDSALGFFKTELKASFDLPDGDQAKLYPDVWLLYPLYTTGNMDNADYAFMKPTLNLDADLTGAGSSAIAKTVLSCALYKKDFTDSKVQAVVSALSAKQGADGLFTDGYGNATINDTIWSVIALQIAKNQGATVSYDVNKAVSGLKTERSADKGFNDWGDEGSVDTTGMAMIMFSIVNTDEAKSLNKDCIAFMQSVLDDNGNLVGKGAWDSANSCSQAYGIVGLLVAGQDVTSAKWTKGGKTLIDVLLTYRDANGGFWYDAASKTGTGFYTAPDYFSTYQAMLALSDIEYGNLWLKLATPSQPATTDAGITVAPTTTAQSDITNPTTGTQGVSRIMIVIIIICVILVLGALLLPYFNKKK